MNTMPRRIVQVRLNLPQAFRNATNNNNNLDNRYVLARNQLYRIAFLRFTLLYARIFSELQRKIFEFLILLMALFSFISLIYVHIAFVQSPITCLDRYLDEWQNAKILRVELLDKNGNNKYSLSDSYYKEHATRLLEAGVKPCPRLHRLRTDINGSSENMTAKDFPDEEDSIDVADLLRCKLNETESDEGILYRVAEELGSVFNLNPNEEINIIEYSFEYGFLRLSPSMRKNLSLQVLFVVIDPSEDACVGGIFNKFIFDKFLGYDELLLSSVRYLAQKSNYNGFVRNVGREIEYIFINDDSWLRSYFSAAILMPLTTFSVSLLLRFAHQQIFVACSNVFELVRLRQQRRYNGSPLLTVVFALFGMMAIITSFFHHSTLTLNIIFMVWLADFYDSVCCRTLMAKRHWYRFFFLYHYVFYAYHYRFNGLHWQLNLVSSWLFLLHSMLFFFHHYELPYYVQSYLEFRDSRLRRRDLPRIPRINVPHSNQAASAMQDDQMDEEVSNLAGTSNQEQLGRGALEDRANQAYHIDGHFQDQSEITRSAPSNSSIGVAQNISSEELNLTSSRRTAVPFERKLKIEWHDDDDEMEENAPGLSHKRKENISENLGKSQASYIGCLPKALNVKSSSIMKTNMSSLADDSLSENDDFHLGSLNQPRRRLNTMHDSETNFNTHERTVSDSNLSQEGLVASHISEHDDLSNVDYSYDRMDELD